jgi:hypothetical protein
VFQADLRPQRDLRTAVWVEEPVNQPVNQGVAFCKDADMRIYKWTIEDSPVWKAVKAVMGLEGC